MGGLLQWLWMTLALVASVALSCPFAWSHQQHGSGEVPAPMPFLATANAHASPSRGEAARPSPEAGTSSEVAVPDREGGDPPPALMVRALRLATPSHRVDMPGPLPCPGTVAIQGMAVEEGGKAGPPATMA